MATLVSELRKANNPTPIPRKPTLKTTQPTPAAPIVETVVQTQALRRQLANTSAEVDMAWIRFGDLPPTLRVKYSKAKDVFYQMMELKFALNDLPDNAEVDALAIQIQIEELEEQRDLLWEALKYWQRHKTELPSSDKDYTTMSELQLDKEKRNIKSSITKLQQRADANYLLLDACTDSRQQQLIEDKIRRGEQRIHMHKQNLLKIDNLL